MTNLTTFPSIFLFNVSKAGARHVSDSPNNQRLLLAAFCSTLQSALENEWVVQGAIYAPTGGTVFIDTDDEQWDDHVGLPADEDLWKMVSSKEHPTDMQSPVQMFNQAPGIKTGFCYIDANPTNPRSMMKQFIDAICSNLNQSELVLSASYGPYEGASILMREG
ncbi:hypothetical protein CVT25_012419 [Psilocybe cyanescens]|uniref:Uncharacterized protein n=1 Tax=Psilocybe cyanescens TaxID=93625 RepID=A0A409X7N8_PSICY|nr:hypothetical protein CVT25_012419 [Psilocybe cyanescens]